MQSNDINVAQISSGSWLVSEGAEHRTLRTFKLRAHAVVFGRTRAHSLGSNMYIYGPDRIGVLQTRESLTYPFVLN